MNGNVCHVPSIGHSYADYLSLHNADLRSAAEQIHHRGIRTDGDLRIVGAWLDEADIRKEAEPSRAAEFEPLFGLLSDRAVLYLANRYGKSPARAEEISRDCAVLTKLYKVVDRIAQTMDQMNGLDATAFVAIGQAIDEARPKPTPA